MLREETATPVAIEPEGDWYGLYKGSTSRDDHLFEPASVRHPAKMSLALTNKILDTMQEWGWIETGSLVVDPFGGRGTTALCWLARNAANRALTVELEPHFVEMQNRNKEHAQRRLHRELAWVILQGDSRRFDEYYAEGKAASVLSAPYAGHDHRDHTAEKNTAYENDRLKGQPARCGRGGFRDSEQYGSTPGQIGNLPDSAITSAPYADQAVSQIKSNRGNAYRRGEPGGSANNVEVGYGSTPGQIGRLKDPPAASVLSAPYAAAENRRAAGKVQEGEVSDAITRAYDATNHGQTAGNIANLPDAALLSAPYGNQHGKGGKEEKSVQHGKLPARLGRSLRDHREKQCAPGQIANLPDKDAAAVTSAPFEDSLASDDPEKRGGFLKTDPKRRNDPGLTATYGDAAAVTSAQEDAAGDASAVLSPPYDGLHVGGKGGEGPGAAGHEEERKRIAAGCPTEHAGMATRTGYGDTAANTEQGQIGVLQSETYAQACGLVYASLAKAGIRYVASVTKDPTGQPKGIKFCKCGSAPKGRKNG